MPLKIGDIVHDPGDPSVGISAFQAEVVGKLDNNTYLARDASWWIVVYAEDLAKVRPIVKGGTRWWRIRDSEWMPLLELIKDYNKFQ